MVTKMYSERSRTKILTILVAVMLVSVCKVWAIDITFDSDAIIGPGDEYDIVSVYDTPPVPTVVHMFGGSVYRFYTYDSSTVNILGGELERRIDMWDSSTVNIYGGTIFLDSPGFGDSSTLNIFGGDVGMGQPGAGGSSMINIYGYDFSEFPAFSLTGYLSDGSPFEFIELTHAIPHINLIVIPEPATILLLGLGTILLRKQR